MRLFLSAIFCVGLLLSAPNAYAGGDAPKDGEGPGVHFVELNPLILPVIDEYGLTQMVSLVVAVEVDSEEKVAKVNKLLPRLTDAYLSDLYGTFATKAPKNGVIPISYLKKRMNKMSSKVLGEHVVDDVLVQVMQSRRT